MDLYKHSRRLLRARRRRIRNSRKSSSRREGVRKQEMMIDQGGIV